MIMKLNADRQQQDTKCCAAWWQEYKPPCINSEIHFDTVPSSPAPRVY